MHRQTQSPLFRVPYEIRVIIYELLFSKIITKPTIEYLYDAKDQTRTGNESESHGFMLTCQICHREAIEIFYKNNTFDWSEVRPRFLKSLDSPGRICERVKSISNLLLVRSDVSTLGWTAVGLRTRPEVLIKKFPSLERLSFRFSEPLRWYCPRREDCDKLSYNEFYEGLASSPIPPLGESPADQSLNDFMEGQPQIDFTLYITWYLDYETSFGTTKTEMQRNAMNTKLRAIKIFSQAPVHPMYGELSNDRDKFKQWEAFAKT